MKIELTKKYIGLFSKLNRATTNGVKAPHKPILLLSILQTIDSGEIKENKIEITPVLVARFKDNWKWLVREPFFNANFSLPYFHMKSEKFWHLKLLPGKEIILTNSNSIRSFAQLKDSVDYAYLDELLFNTLLQKESRDILYRFLLEHYFNHPLTTNFKNGLFEEFTNQILNDPQPIYQKLIKKADEEEIFIRSGVFKKVIPNIYNHTCSVSGMQISANFDVQMIDACHIVPFSISHDDTISNGISLSPTIHRAFDRGLITIDNEYRLVISNTFTESTTNSFIKSYEGKCILLPKQKSHFPLVQNLEWHRINVFRNFV